MVSFFNPSKFMSVIRFLCISFDDKVIIIASPIVKRIIYELDMNKLFKPMRENRYRAKF